MCFIPLWIIYIKYRCITSVPSLGPHCSAASVQQHHSPGFLSLLGWDDWVGHGWRWRECRNCSYRSFNAPLPCISVSLRGDKPKWSTNCPAGENCKWVKAIKLLCLQVWFCLDRLSFSWPVEMCYVDGWCYFMLGKNWDTGTYSVLPYNHFFKLLCCYLELHFLRGQSQSTLRCLRTAAWQVQLCPLLWRVQIAFISRLILNGFQLSKKAQGKHGFEHHSTCDIQKLFKN